MNKKPFLSLVMDKELLEKLDKERRAKSVKENKDISRSAYVSQLVEKGLSKSL